MKDYISILSDLEYKYRMTLKAIKYCEIHGPADRTSYLRKRLKRIEKEIDLAKIDQLRHNLKTNN